MPASRRAEFDTTVVYGTYTAGAPPFVPIGFAVGRLVRSFNFTSRFPGFRWAFHYLTCPPTTPIAGPPTFTFGGMTQVIWSAAMRVQTTTLPIKTYCVIDVIDCTYDVTDPYLRIMLAEEPFAP